MDALSSASGFGRGGEGTEPDKCSVCLRTFDQQAAVASLPNCRHEFCLNCILQWSQTANTCPIDRISFAVIHQRRCPGGNIQKTIKVCAVQREEEEDDDDDEEEAASGPLTCEECGRSDRGHQLLVCRQCDSGYHTDCLASPSTSDPEDDWVCPECAAISQNTDNSMETEAEVSDGELTELLAEGDDAALVSSRLRPSTLRRPQGLTERRRSLRIRSRTGSRTRSSNRAIPRFGAQTSVHVPKYLLRASTSTQVSAPHHGSTSHVSVGTRTRNQAKRCKQRLNS